MAKFPNVIGLRLTDEDVAKLDRLAARTYRGRGAVMRCLIELADAAPERDLVMRLSAAGAADSAPETAEVGRSGGVV